jgi:hypothetical protein
MKKILFLLFLFISICISAQTPLTINGETVTDATTGDWGGRVIARTVPTALTYTNNSITSVNTSGYMLQAGDEGVGTYNNNLDGAVIIGNKLTWNGTDMTSLTHGLFTGCNINVSLKYNYLYQVPMGIIRKSASSMVNVSGGLAYNILNKTFIGVVVKGISGVNIYNNTFYSNRTWENTASGRGLIDVYTNTDGGVYSVSHNTKIKNNIFYTKYQIVNIRILDEESLTGFESDYNVYYCEEDEPLFDYVGELMTFSEWQDLGYDTHSVIIDPDFVDFTNFIPSVRLNYGTNLGTTWQTGLSTGATWTTGSSPSTTTQNGTWQVGARIYAEETPPETGDYYLSPAGDDDGAGTIEDPWFSLEKAWTAIVPGDIVYLRGGTYEMTESQELEGVSGTNSLPISILAYPGETPIITKAGSWNHSQNAGIYLEGDYFHWKGITITGFTQESTSGNWMGFRTAYSEHNTFELIDYYNNSSGFEITDGCNDILVLNSDFHHNYDPITEGDAYGNADGCACNPSPGATVTFRGCRFWSNSDDGLDLYAANGLVIIDKCWAWSNGYAEDGVTKGGNGCGYKLGVTTGNYSTTHLRTVTNSLAFHNRQGGFAQNSAQCVSWIYNNTAYHNADGSDVYRLNFEFAEASIVHVLRNNIAYANQHPSNLQANYDNCITSNNTWNGSVTVSDADFVSVSMTGVDGVRQSNGNLPNIDFLKLAEGSDLIGAGTNVGLTEDGIGNLWNTTPDNPSMGAFEFGSEPPPDIPVTGIYVHGTGNATTITIDKGTLQMVADITPSNATDPSVTWLCTNGTGSGSINSAGLLTAESNGTVVIKATTNDGSEIYDTIEITISNQSIIYSKPIFKNGYSIVYKGKVIAYP